jgi:hypothetical protein
LERERRWCLELPVVGLDLVEVSALQDCQNVTALLANRVLLDALSGIAKRRQTTGAVWRSTVGMCQDNGLLAASVFERHTSDVTSSSEWADVLESGHLTLGS